MFIGDHVVLSLQCSKCEMFKEDKEKAERECSALKLQNEQLETRFKALQADVVAAGGKI